MNDSYKLQKKLSKIYLLFKESFEVIFINENKIKISKEKYKKEYIIYTTSFKNYIKEITVNFKTISGLIESPLSSVLIESPLSKTTDYEQFNFFQKINNITKLLKKTKEKLLQINEDIFKRKQESLNSYQKVINILSYFYKFDDNYEEFNDIGESNENQLLKEFKKYLDNFIEVHKKQLE